MFRMGFTSLAVFSCVVRWAHAKVFSVSVAHQTLSVVIITRAGGAKILTRRNTICTKFHRVISRDTYQLAITLFNATLRERTYE